MVEKFNPQESIKRARAEKSKSKHWSIKVGAGKYVWTNSMDRVKLIRNGLPYETIEVISKRINIPVKDVLRAFGLPQTTYNKKKKDLDLLNGRDSEAILVLVELLDFGIDVFNHEQEKFHRWLKKPNTSLGGVAPDSLFDSLTGIMEVKNCLSRLEYGNIA